MRVLKSALTVMVSTMIIGFSGAYASAEVTGVVNLDKIGSNYSKAQDVSADLKVKEAELQKFLADAQKQLKNTTSPVEKKNLEDKLTQEFKTKAESFNDYQVKQIRQVEDNIYAAIEKVAKDNKIDIVLNRAGVVLGGNDITDQVLNILNASTSTKDSKK